MVMMADGILILYQKKWRGKGGKKGGCTAESLRQLGRKVGLLRSQNPNPESIDSVEVLCRGGPVIRTVLDAADGARHQKCLF